MHIYILICHGQNRNYLECFLWGQLADVTDNLANFGIILDDDEDIEDVVLDFLFEVSWWWVVVVFFVSE